MTGPRVACLYVPLFPLAARLRAEPETNQDAVAVVAGSELAPKVLAASAAARAAGVHQGLTLPQAKALAPALVAKRRDEKAEEAAHQALLEAADAFSPLVEDAGPGVAFLDVTGGGDEKALGFALIRRAKAAGLQIRVGFAATKAAARLAARQADGAPLVVPPGEQEKFLEPLPIQELEPNPDLLETLTRWGVRTVGALAALPDGELASRLGLPGWELQRAAKGIDEKPLIPRRHPRVFGESAESEWPLCEIPPFLAFAEPVLSRLCARLQGMGQACRRMEATLTLDPHGHDVRSFSLPSATRDTGTLLALLALELETRPPRGGILGLSVLAEPENPKELQLSLFGPPAQSPDKLSAALARLAALLGPDRVGTPKPVDSHRPEAFALAPFDPPPPPDGLEKRAAPSARPFMMIRALRPAVLLDVELSSDAPRFIKSKEGQLPRIFGRVRVASGPWRLAESWWTSGPVDRAYWDVELEQGGVFRLCFDEVGKKWSADGVYD